MYVAPKPTALACTELWWADVRRLLLSHISLGQKGTWVHGHFQILLYVPHGSRKSSWFGLTLLSLAIRLHSTLLHHPRASELGSLLLPWLLAPPYSVKKILLKRKSSPGILQCHSCRFLTKELPGEKVSFHCGFWRTRVHHGREARQKQLSWWQQQEVEAPSRFSQQASWERQIRTFKGLTLVTYFRHSGFPSQYLQPSE